jgi:hypothetical protein
MIRRYSREPKRQIWTEENKFSLWLRIEILACEARHIPLKDLVMCKNSFPRGFLAGTIQSAAYFGVISLG